jgi:hypothetical protein
MVPLKCFIVISTDQRRGLIILLHGLGHCYLFSRLPSTAAAILMDTSQTRCSFVSWILLSFQKANLSAQNGHVEDTPGLKLAKKKLSFRRLRFNDSDCDNEGHLSEGPVNVRGRPCTMSRLGAALPGARPRYRTGCLGPNEMDKSRQNSADNGGHLAKPLKAK